MKVRDAIKNVDGAYEFEKDYRAFERKLVSGDYPHHEQVRATAMILATCFDLSILELMKDQGFDAFVAKVEAGQFCAEPGATRTSFTLDELRGIYGYILQVLEHRKARSAVRGPATETVQ